MTLSDETAELLRTGRPSGSTRSGTAVEWDGRWLVVVLRVPEERREVRHQLRSRLAWAGLGSLGGGVWLTPHVEREAELAAAINDEPRRRRKLVRGRARQHGRPALGGRRRVGARGGLRAVPRRSSRTSQASGPNSPEACFRQQTLLVHAWRKFPFLDPDLPPQLLPERWPRERAHAAVRRPPRPMGAGGARVLRVARGRAAADDRPGGMTQLIDRLELLDIPGTDPAAPVTVLLHEGLGSVKLWRGFPQALANATHSRTIAFSRYGHGQSDPPPRPRTPEFMHEEALEVLPALLGELEIERPVLVGHSDGGSIALIHAAQHPVQAVVAIAPHVFVEPMCLAEIRKAKDAYTDGGLRERMARHHRDPDAAFYGWNDVWLAPALPRVGHHRRDRERQLRRCC